MVAVPWSGASGKGAGRRLIEEIQPCARHPTHPAALPAAGIVRRLGLSQLRRRRLNAEAGGRRRGSRAALPAVFVVEAQRGCRGAVLVIGEPFDADRSLSTPAVPQLCLDCGDRRCRPDQGSPDGTIIRCLKQRMRRTSTGLEALALGVLLGFEVTAGLALLRARAARSVREARSGRVAHAAGTTRRCATG
jgi:hypothetical protein